MAQVCSIYLLYPLGESNHTASPTFRSKLKVVVFVLKRSPKEVIQPNTSIRNRIQVETSILQLMCQTFVETFTKCKSLPPT